jgi:hypothetical protein
MIGKPGLGVIGLRDLMISSRSLSLSLTGDDVVVVLTVEILSSTGATNSRDGISVE